MANFPEPSNPTFQSIRQIETNDPVLGGAAEIANVVNSPVNYALRAMVERTAWLKAEVEGIDIANASHSERGIARLATMVQVTAGSNDETIVTPFTLQNKLTAAIAAIPDASEAVKGLVQRATQAEGDAGTNTEKHMTPATTKSAITVLLGDLLNVYTGHLTLTAMNAVEYYNVATLNAGESFLIGAIGMSTSNADTDAIFAPLEVNGQQIRFTPNTGGNMGVNITINAARQNYWYITIG